MKIKRILKPDLRKILLFIVFIFISIYIWSEFWWFPPPVPGALGCIHITKCIEYTHVIGSTFIIILFQPIALIFEPLSSIFHLLLVNLPYYYLISCLISSLWSKRNE